MKNFSKEFYKKITKIIYKNNLQTNYKKVLEIFSKNSDHMGNFRQKATTRESCSSQATTRYCGVVIKMIKISENFR